MNKEEKRNIIVAAVLAVGAVVILWYMRSGPVVYTADPNATAVPDTTGVAAPAAIPGYMSYNVPPYDPGSLPPISNVATVGGSVFNTNTDNSTGKGCCPGCAGENSGATSNDIGAYYGLMGLGSLAGAA